MSIRAPLGAVGIAIAVMSLCACNQAKSPDTVAQDTAGAKQKADENLSQAKQDANAKIADANAKVNQEENAVEHTAAVQNEKVNETQAKGTYEVAMARCEGLSGDDQRACKDQAKAAYDTALAQAKQTKTVADPQH
jgi:hypothetical protein